MCKSFDHGMVLDVLGSFYFKQDEVAEELDIHQHQVLFHFKVLNAMASRGQAAINSFRVKWLQFVLCQTDCLIKTLQDCLKLLSISLDQFFISR